MNWRHKRTWAFAWTLVLLLSLQVTATHAITWGEVDVDNVYQNVGMMQIIDTNTGELTNWCSGVLIHPRVFLTAAHCVFYFGGDLNSADFTTYVNFDPDPLANPWNRFEVFEVRVHPNSNAGLPILANPDSAVLIFGDPITGIDPAILPPVGYLDGLKAAGVLREGHNGADFTIVGTGSTLEWPPPSQEFDYLRRSATSEYLALRNDFLTQSQHPRHGNGGACWFDSGGPAFFTDADTTYVVGTTSTGDANCISTNISYRTDTIEAREFILDVLAGLD